jgi:predicted glycoside hydrolase/deacetylase ChbG (UPF0249 family)
MTRKLILNADDFGLSHSINESIIDLLNRNLLTSASILVKRNDKAFQEAVYAAKEFNKRVGFGLHLDLDDFFLFDETSHYGNNEKDIIDNFIEVINDRKEAIKKDIILQIETLKQTGLTISHIDGHHFIHQFTAILQLLAPIMNNSEIRAMRFNPSFYVSDGSRTSAVNIIKKYNIKIPHAFCDLSEIMYGNRNLDLEEAYIIEVMIHSEVEVPGASSWRIDQYKFLLKSQKLFDSLKIVSFNGLF